MAVIKIQKPQFQCEESDFHKRTSPGSHMSTVIPSLVNRDGNPQAYSYSRSPILTLEGNWAAIKTAAPSQGIISQDEGGIISFLSVISSDG